MDKIIHAKSFLAQNGQASAPERCDLFLKTAADYAKLLGADTAVQRLSDCVQVSITLPAVADLTDLKGIIALADEVSYVAASDGKTVTFTLECYTESCDK